MLAPIDRPVVCPVMVGRERYLEQLDGLLATTGSGSGQTVFLTGEAGVGKSRMVSEVKARAAHLGRLILQGNCFEADVSLPYAPILDILRTLLPQHGPGQIARFWEPFAPELVKILPELQLRVPGLTPSPSLDPEQEKRRLFDAICAFFNTLSVSNSLLVVVEDLHWTDDASLDFLLYMARRIVNKSVLLLITYRSDEVRPLTHFLATLDRERLSSEMRLDRLPINDVDVMMRRIFDLKRPMRGEFLQTIYSLTEGNAFFIEEVLKSLTSAGEIFYADGAWERKPMHELHIPRSVQDAVQRRAEGLSEDTRRTLELASVMGRRFDFTLLEAVTGYDERALLAIIKELMSAQLVVEESVDRFAFRHALTCKTIYSDLLARERRSLHRTIAETIQKVYADSLDSHVSDLAHHCFEAGMWKEVLEYACQAGENARALYSPRAAIEQFNHAVEAASKLGVDPPTNIYRSRGMEYETLGEFDLARTDYESALALSRRDSNQADEWEALLDLGKLWAGRDYGKTGEYFGQALELARKLDSPASLASSLNRVGNWYANIDQPYNAVPYHREALDIFDTLKDTRGTAESLDLLGMTTYLSGDLLNGADYYRRAIELFTQLNDKEGLCSSLAMLPLCSGATYHTDTLVGVAPDVIDGISECLEALNIARDIGWRAGEAFSLWMLGFCLGMRGDYGLALGYAEDAMSVATEIGHSQWMAASGCSLGSIYVDVFALDKGRKLLEDTFARAQEIGSMHWTRTAAGMLASCCTLQGDLGRAGEVLDTVMPSDLQWQTFGQRRCWQARIELAIACGEYEDALVLLEQLYSNVQHSANEPNLNIPRLAMLKGEALLGLGRLEEAENWLAPGLEGAKTHLSSSIVWRIELLLARLYTSQSRPEDAAHAYAQSHALVEQLAATITDNDLRIGYLEATSHLFPQVSPSATGTQAKRLSSRSPGGLTGRELEVATLVAQGKTNRDIADQLVLGERTIETHVGNVLSKLGFTSRAQIAVWAVEQNVTHKT